jgi:hypothetical protein
MSETHDAGPASPPVLTQVAGCTSGSCPAVYRTDRGTYVVQGSAIDPASAGVSPSPGEALVEIPAELVAEMLRQG